MSVIQTRLEDLRTVLFQWVDLVTDYTFIDDDQYSQEPDEAHITYSLITNLMKLGAADSVIYSSEQDSFVLTGDRAITTSLKARGTPRGRGQFLRATDMLAELQWTIDRPDVVDLFAAHGLVLMGIQPIIETTVTEDGVTIPRASMDLTIHMALSETIELESIESVEIAGTVETDDGDIDFPSIMVMKSEEE